MRWKLKGSERDDNHIHKKFMGKVTFLIFSTIRTVFWQISKLGGIAALTLMERMEKPYLSFQDQKNMPTMMLSSCTCCIR